MCGMSEKSLAWQRRMADMPEKPPSINYELREILPPESEVFAALAFLSELNN